MCIKDCHSCIPSLARSHHDINNLFLISLNKSRTEYIIIKFINCNWVVTRWQWLFYMYTNMKSVTTKFKSGGLHEKHVVATWNDGNRLSICF